MEEEISSFYNVGQIFPVLHSFWRSSNNLKSSPISSYLALARNRSSNSSPKQTKSQRSMVSLPIIVSVGIYPFYEINENCRELTLEELNPCTQYLNWGKFDAFDL